MTFYETSFRAPRQLTFPSPMQICPIAMADEVTPSIRRNHPKAELDQVAFLLRKFIFWRVENAGTGHAYSQFILQREAYEADRATEKGPAVPERMTRALP